MLNRGPIKTPVTAITASSTRAIMIQTGCRPMALAARRSSRRIRPHPSYPCGETLTYLNDARFASFTPVSTMMAGRHGRGTHYGPFGIKR